VEVNHTHLVEGGYDVIALVAATSSRVAGGQKTQLVHTSLTRPTTATHGAASLVSSYVENRAARALYTHNHAAFNLSYRLVLETQRHAALFDDEAGKALIEYWLRVARLKRFEIQQIKLLPNHCHLRIRLTPTLSILDCVLALMNNSWAMMNKRFGEC